MATDSATVERPITCVTLRAGAPFVGKQGFNYAPAVSAESVGSSAIHMQLLTVPPGASANAHKHEAHETAIYVLSGEVGMWYGEKLEQHMVSRAGDGGRRAHRPQRAGKRRAHAGTGGDSSIEFAGPR